MSRTRRKISPDNAILRELVINNELVYPEEFYHFNHKFYGSKATRDHNNIRTDWDMFFSCRWIHGYDGNNYGMCGDPSSKYPKGYYGCGWFGISSRKCKKFLKRKGSQAARLYAKREIRNLLIEINN